MSTIKIVRGSTFRDTLRWGSEELVFVFAQVITGAPVTLNIPNHGIPDGWPLLIEDHRGFDPLEVYYADVIDADTIGLVGINGTSIRPGSATVRYKKPVEMLGYSARMRLLDKPGGVVLHEMSSSVGEGITIDHLGYKLIREIPADITETFTWRRGAYEFDMVQGDYVIRIDSGPVEVGTEAIAENDLFTITAGEQGPQGDLTEELIDAAALAVSKADDAALSAIASEDSATLSSASATLAQAWATQVDTEVVVGEGYGAKKYALDAASAATTAASSATTASTKADEASASALDAQASAASAQASELAAAAAVEQVTIPMLELSTSLIRTQTIIAENHAFN